MRYQSPVDFQLICALLLAPWIIVAQTSFAQTVQTDQRELVRGQAPSPFAPNVPPAGTEAGNAEPIASDVDLGEQQILKRVEEYQPFTASVGVPFYWTSNVALTSSGEQDDFVVAPAAAVFYEPRVNQNLYEFLGVRQQFFYYDRFDYFNFGSFDLEVGFRYLIPHCHNLVLRFEYRFQSAH